MMENKIRFSENVILMDVAFLNEMVCGGKRFLEDKLGRELRRIDLPSWLSYMALDAGIRGSDNELQVLLVHNEDTYRLECCEPAGLKQLDAQACRTSLGEFAFSCVTPAKITSCEELFLDLMTLALDSSDVKCLLLLPFHPVYGRRVEDELCNFFKEKSEEERRRAVYFVMEKPAVTIPVRWDFANYSILQALGVKPDEL